MTMQRSEHVEDTPEPATATEAMPTPSFDEEYVSIARNLMSQGIMSEAEVQQHYRLTPAELEAAKQPAAPDRSSIEAELRTIEKLRREDRRAYDKDDALQARERELLEAQQASREANKRELSDGSELPDSLREAWEASGGVDHNLRQVQEAALAALDPLNREDAVCLENSFNGLPVGARSKILAHLAVPAVSSPRVASDDAIKAFRSTEEGAALVEEWGAKAARNLATLQQRMGMALGAMSAADREAAENWFDSLPSAAAASVMRSLLR